MEKHRPPRSRILFRIVAFAFAGVVLLACLFAAAVFTGSNRQGKRVFTEYTDLDNGGRFETVNGVEMHFRVMEPAVQTPSDRPLVLIHGLMGSSKDFEHVQPALALHRTVISVDLPPFGRSDKDTELDYSKAAMASQVAGLMTALGFDQYDVLGHSMGGEVALRLALEYPDHVTELILLNSAGYAQTGRRANLPPLLIDLVFRNYYIQRQVFRSSLFNDAPHMPEAFDKLYYYSGQIPGETLAAFIADDDSGHVADRLGEVRQPVLIVWGEQDRIIPLAQSALLQGAIPDSRLEVLADCGHLPYLEKPAELTALIEAFLERD